MSKLKNLLFSFILVGLTAYAASFFTQVGIDSWYRLAAKPILTLKNTDHLPDYNIQDYQHDKR